MALTRITKGVIKPNENYDTHNINSTGIVTAIGLDVNGNGDISGNLSVGGVLTYEDVTSIDSVGIITAQSDIHVGGGVSAVGVGTFGGLVSPYADIDDFLDVGSNIQLGNAGVITATTFKGDGDFVDIDVDGHTNLDNVSVAGVSTFSALSKFNEDVYFLGASSKTITFDKSEGHIRYLDNAKAQFGTQGDLHIYHSGAASIVANHGTGDLYLQDDGNVIIGKVTNAEVGIKVIGDGAVELYHNNTKRLETSSVGVSIPQDLDVDGHTNLDAVSIAGVTTIGNSLHANGNLTITNAAPTITLTDSDADDYALQVNGGSFIIHDTTAGATRLSITDGGNINIGSDLDVDGHTNLDNVSIAGVTTMSGNLTISNTDPRIIFVDTNNNPDFTLHANGGEMQVENSGSGTQVKLESSGSTRLFGNVIANKDLDVDGHTNLDNVSIAGITTITKGLVMVAGTSNLYQINGALSYYAADNAVYLNGAGNSGSLRLNATGSSNDRTSINLTGQSNSAADAIIFRTADNERLRIHADGEVDVKGGAAGQNALLVTGNYSASNNVDIQTWQRSGGAVQAKMIYKDAGTSMHFGTDTAHSFLLITGGSDRIKIASNSAATSIGGSMVFNAMLTVQGDISGALFQLKATENTNRLMVSGSNTNGVEVNLYDEAGGQKGILGVSGTEFFIKAPNNSAPLTFYTHNGSSIGERLRIKDDGDVVWNGTGTETPGYNNTTVGMGFEPRNGTIFLSRADNLLILANRNNDGRMIAFNQGGAQKFNIGLKNSGADLAFNSGTAEGTERLKITSSGIIKQFASGGDNQFISKRTGSTYSNGDYYFYLFAQNNGGTNVGSLGIVRDTGNDNSRIMLSTAVDGNNYESLRIGQRGNMSNATGSWRAASEKYVNTLHMPQAHEGYNAGSSYSGLSVAAEMWHQSDVRGTSHLTTELFSTRMGHNAGMFIYVEVWFSCAVSNYQGYQALWANANRTGSADFTINNTGKEGNQLGTDTAGYFDLTYASAGSAGNQRLTWKVTTSFGNNYTRVLYKSTIVGHDYFTDLTVIR